MVANADIILLTEHPPRNILLKKYIEEEICFSLCSSKLFTQ